MNIMGFHMSPILLVNFVSFTYCVSYCMDWARICFLVSYLFDFLFGDFFLSLSVEVIMQWTCINLKELVDSVMRVLGVFSLLNFCRNGKEL